MYVAIVSYTLQPGKKAEFLAWYESIVPHLKEWIPGSITQYVVETDANTVMSFAVFETEAAATGASISAEAQKVLRQLGEFLAEGGVSERKVYPILAHLP